MSDFGLNPDGFNRKRLDDIKEKIEEAIIDAFGEVNTEPDSVFGQLIGIFSKPLADLWMELENTYFSMYPATAEGFSLDNAVDLVGISRLESTKSRVIAAVSGDQGTLIPAGSQVEVAETNELFTNPQDGIITRTNALIVRYNITQVADNTDYTIIINGSPFIHNSGVDASPQSIAEGLVSEINDGAEPVTAEHVTGGQFDVNADQIDLPFTTTHSANVLIINRTSPLLFEATESGPILVLPGTLTEIVTPVSGWDSVNNLEEGVQGRNTETDQELRIRRLESLRVLGAASVEAIQARLRQNVQDVTAAFVFENREPFEVNDRPPHSFECVVVGGLDSEIAQKIWEIKPAGIQTFGNVEVLVEDSNGDLQLIRFSRPENVYVWVNVELTIVSGVFPSDGTDVVAQNILSFSENYDVGDDVIFQQLFAPIYQVEGIIQVNLSLATSEDPAGPPGSFSSANVTIDETEIASFNLNRISVTIV